MAEFPLVIFTVLSQLATGAVITIWVLDSFTAKPEISLGKFTTLTILIITGVSILASLFHLGHPLNAYRALIHLGSSWLSREVFLFALFLLMLLIYFFQWKEEKNRSRKTIGGITALIGLLAVISSGMVYVLPANPAWNNFGPVLFFILTAALLGPLYVGILFKFKGENVSRLLTITGSVIVISLFTFIVYTTVLLSSQGAAHLTGLNIIDNGAFWLRIIVGWLVPLALLFSYVIKKTISSKLIVAYLFFLVLIGELIGRGLFYNTIVHLQVAAF